VRSGRRGRILRGVAGHACEHDRIRRVRAVDGVDRIVDRRVHDREAAGGMHRGRLRARRAHDAEQHPVPLHDGIDRLRVRGTGTGRAGAEQREREQKLRHRGVLSRRGSRPGADR